MAGNAKQYGLVMPKKGNQGLLRPRPSVFDDDSDSSQEGGGGDWVKKALRQEAQKTTQKKQTVLDMQRAVQEDPTVYQYDEVYDKMEEKKMEEKAVKKSLDKKPRYIQSLLKEAERRKREQERRNERLIQKEREAEGEQFKDKEAFVTSAYREKLEEFRKLDEEEKRQDYIDSLTDVSKQQDLSGFYRHLYRQAVTGEEIPGERKIKTEKLDEGEQPLAVTTEQPKVPDVEIKSEGSKSSEAEKKGRQYRKRKASSSESEGEGKDSDARGVNPNNGMKSPSGKETQEKSTKEKKKKKSKSIEENPDADTASSSSSEDNSSDSEGKKSTQKKADVVIASGSEEGEIKEVEVKNVGDKDKTSKENGQEKQVEDKKAPDIPKINIWVKRTVGAVFDAAVERYYQRKASKLSSSG